MKSAPYLSALTFLLALQAGVLWPSAAVLAPVLVPAEALTPAPAWSPKIKPGPKPGLGGDKRPKPPLQPCYPNPRTGSGGI